MTYYVLSTSPKEREALDYELQEITGYYSSLSHTKDLYFNEWPVICIDTIGGQIYSDIIRDIQYLTIGEIRKIFMKPKTKRYIVFWTLRIKELNEKIINRALELGYQCPISRKIVDETESVTLDTESGRIMYTTMSKYDHPNHETGDLERLMMTDDYIFDNFLKIGEHIIYAANGRLSIDNNTFSGDEVEKIIKYWNENNDNGSWI